MLARAPGEDGCHLYTCPLCEAMCGLEIQVENGKVASIHGNRDDTWSRGHICRSRSIVVPAPAIYPTWR